MNSLVNPEVLLLLEKEVEKYPAINDFLDKYRMNSGDLLTTNGIAEIDFVLSSSAELLAECFTFLDALKLYGMMFSASADTLTTDLMRSICKTRSLPQPKFCTNAAILGPFISESSEALEDMMDNNPHLCAIVIMAVLKKMFYK